MAIRLSERLIRELTRSLEESFGPIDAIVFGSRTDDARRGGDIDLAIPGNLTREEFRAKRARFLANLLRRGFDLDIDLVQTADAPPLLQREIQRRGVPLCHCRMDVAPGEVTLERKEG
uniref:Nucleotidyltransferase domain-containing protein n=1 Tax=Candidatus Kentrum sp. LPFa TaxID=2126335 RepID=A0A450VUW9_9GAMM|nr:MAG: Nucleotidyltransferase domain-containing protein [Candidatus Kentron sp. LPFa]VFK25155.1 MAG: Nucleotidyltransferase domain-containing protein [Candidatus Kentron sp. LPFa]